mgnify:FL=1
MKRWNKVFIHDKIMSEWIYRVINLVMYVLDLYHWLLLSIIRLKTPREEKRKYYFSICAIFKDESLSLKEWIEYHKLIGVEHFYLYDNNSTDSSLLILKQYVDEGIVTLIDWKVMPPAQTAAYNDFKKNFWTETQWVAFIDLDEYICLKYETQIKEWFSKYENYPSLVVYWKMFGSSGLIEHDNSRLITEQYFVAWDKFSDIGKPIFNTRFEAIETTLKYIHSLPAKLSICGHDFAVPPINEFRKFIKYKSNRVGIFKSISDFTIQINHYATKSYLEYFCTRRKRGDVNAFANNTSIKAYKYTQEFAVKPDYTIYRFLPFLKVRMDDTITNYFDD